MSLPSWRINVYRPILLSCVAVKQLEYGKNKRLHDYKINYDKATVHLVLGLPGGLWPLEAVKRAARGELQPLPGFITLTKAKNEPDVISLEDSTDELRAKMPCGHVIGELMNHFHFN